jgi:hypothetical protein
MKQYSYVEPRIRELELAIALELGLGRSLNNLERSYIKWYSENDCETSGLLLDWFKGIRGNALNNVIGVDEAAKLWKLSPGYIKNLCATGKIKAKKIGKTWVIDETQPNPSKSSG